MSIIKITQSRHRQTVEISINGELAARLDDGKSEFEYEDFGAANLATIFAGFDLPPISSRVDTNKTILDKAEYTPDYARWIDKQQGWQNKTVDDAGYLISTSDKLNSAVERLDSVANESVMSYSCSGIFGADEPVSSSRAHKANTLREIAESLLACAAELDGPVVDESNSPQVGYDADHSVL